MFVLNLLNGSKKFNHYDDSLIDTLRAGTGLSAVCADKARKILNPT